MEGALAGLTLRSPGAERALVLVGGGGGRAAVAGVLLGVVLDLGGPATLVQAPLAACMQPGVLWLA